MFYLCEGYQDTRGPQGRRATVAMSCSHSSVVDASSDMKAFSLDSWFQSFSEGVQYRHLWRWRPLRKWRQGIPPLPFWYSCAHHVWPSLPPCSVETDYTGSLRLLLQLIVCTEVCFSTSALFQFGFLAAMVSLVSESFIELLRWVFHRTSAKIKHQSNPHGSSDQKHFGF